MNMLIYANIFNRLAQNYQPIKPRDARMLRTHCYVLNGLTMRLFVQFLLFYMETFVMGEGRQVLLKKRSRCREHIRYQLFHFVSRDYLIECMLLNDSTHGTQFRSF